MVGIVCVAITNAIALAQPLVLRRAVDDLYRGVTAEKLGRYALVLFAISVVSGLFSFLMRQRLTGIARRVESDLRDELFTHLLRLPRATFDRRPVGDLMARATDDLDAVQMMLGPGILYLVNTVVRVLLCVGFMLSISRRVTLESLIPLPFVSLLVWFFGDRMHSQFEALQARWSEISGRAQESLSGVRIVRAFAHEDAEVAEFERLNRDYRDQNLSRIRMSGFFPPALALLSGLAALLGLTLGGREVVAGHMTLGQFVAFTVYLAMLNWPVVALGWVIHLFQRGIASFARVAALLDERPTRRVAPRARSTAVPRGALEFRDLWFAYPGARGPALRGITFEVPAGATLGIVGPTGSGKSTLLSLIARVYDPPRGSVLLDGVDVLDHDLLALRRAIALVPQEPVLFSETLADNIAYAAPASRRDAIVRAARIAQLEDDALRLPDGFDTLVGERGVTLSGGQRQRACIARALLAGGAVLLLDDSLSSVDGPTEERLLAGLGARRPPVTTLRVSHRVSAVRDADLIIVLAGGTMVECGRHDALVAHRGAYARLVREQQLEAELEAS